MSIQWRHLINCYQLSTSWERCYLVEFWNLQDNHGIKFKHVLKTQETLFCNYAIRSISSTRSTACLKTFKSLSYSSPNVIEINQGVYRWTEYVVSTSKMKNEHIVWLCNIKGRKDSTCKPRRIWQNNIKQILQKQWIQLAPYRRQWQAFKNTTTVFHKIWCFLSQLIITEVISWETKYRILKPTLLQSCVLQIQLTHSNKSLQTRQAGSCWNAVPCRLFPEICR